MEVKYFSTKFYRKKENIIIKKNKFVIYKRNDNCQKEISLKYVEKYLSKKNIKFKVVQPIPKQKVKIIKNNKFVFDNKSQPEENFGNEKLVISNRDKKLMRTSIYRGVSKNGNKWQVLFMNNKIKYYLGNYKYEEVAAKIYDFFAIKFLGKKAKTNFFYNDENTIEKSKFISHKIGK